MGALLEGCNSRWMQCYMDVMLDGCYMGAMLDGCNAKRMPMLDGNNVRWVQC